MRINVSQKELNNNRGSGGLEIYIEGVVGNPQEKFPGCAVFIEKYLGKVRVHVWNNEQDPVTFVMDKK